MFRKTANEMYYFNEDELNQLGNSYVSPQDKLLFNRIDNFKSLVSFQKKRFFRLYPVHIFVLILILLGLSSDIVIASLLAES